MRCLVLFFSIFNSLNAYALWTGTVHFDNGRPIYMDLSGSNDGAEIKKEISTSYLHVTSVYAQAWAGGVFYFTYPTNNSCTSEKVIEHFNSAATKRMSFEEGTRPDYPPNGYIRFECFDTTTSPIYKYTSESMINIIYENEKSSCNVYFDKNVELRAFVGGTAKDTVQLTVQCRPYNRTIPVRVSLLSPSGTSSLELEGGVRVDMSLCNGCGKTKVVDVLDRYVFNPTFSIANTGDAGREVSGFAIVKVDIL